MVRGGIAKQGWRVTWALFELEIIGHSQCAQDTDARFPLSIRPTCDCATTAVHHFLATRAWPSPIASKPRRLPAFWYCSTTTPTSIVRMSPKHRLVPLWLSLGASVTPLSTDSLMWLLIRSVAEAKTARQRLYRTPSWPSPAHAPRIHAKEFDTPQPLPSSSHTSNAILPCRQHRTTM